MARRIYGFTLIELMIVIAIVAIIAAIAIPSYNSMIQKSRRADAVDALLLVQSLQEKWRAGNTGYGSLNDIGFESDGSGSEPSNEGHYSVTVSGTTAISYTATADPVGAQAADSDCDPMVITVNAANPRGLKTPADCWD